MNGPSDAIARRPDLKIRDDGDYWHQVESYIHERTGVGFSHGICPDCVDNVVKPEIEALTKKIKDSG